MTPHGFTFDPDCGPCERCLETEPRQVGERSLHELVDAAIDGFAAVDLSRPSLRRAREELVDRIVLAVLLAEEEAVRNKASNNDTPTPVGSVADSAVSGSNARGEAVR